MRNLRLVDHPYRATALEELHLRPMAPVPIPGEVLQMVRLPAASEWHIAHRLIQDLSGEEVAETARHFTGCVGGIYWSIERHTEAATLTAAVPPNANARDLERISGWMEAMPGGVLRATRTILVADRKSAASRIRAAAFDQGELVAARIGAAEFWSDFRICRDDGLGRSIIVTNGMPAADVGRLVRQLHELGNYRNLALIGLVAVRDQGSELVDIEQGLLSVSAQLSDRLNDQHALDQLLSLAAASAALQSKLQFRLGATAAYGQVVIDRLNSLRSQKVEGYQSLAEFTERRLLPALRTCEAFEQRLEHAAQGIERATAMLRTRIELEVQKQNMALLASVERSAVRQVGLQHLVEGLSVVALSYYAISLLGFALHGFTARGWLGLTQEEIIAILILPVMIAVALFLRSQTRKFAPADRTDGP